MRNFQLNKRSNGMTLLEVLIAITLFAVFMGVFLTVTEMLSVLIPPSNVLDEDKSCNGSTLEMSCIGSAFDNIIPLLEKAYSNDQKPLDETATELMGCADNVNLVMTKLNPDTDFDIAWPSSYRVCVDQYDKFPVLVDGQPRPGLFLLQAEPTEPAFWRKPVQRLFCWPYHLCIDP